jgi:mitochondrial fission process protein 1
MFDKPVEEAVEWTFYQGFKAFGGESAVGQRHAIGRQHELQKESQVAGKVKEKEL